MTKPSKQTATMSFTNRMMAVTTTVKNVVLHGYLRKLKTMKKKYFVLYSDGENKPARLEYYDTEKKFRARHGNPKRSIVLKSCFHINKRLDTKHKFVISLYTKDDCFCIVFDNEAELNLWLQSLLSLHRIEDAEGDKPRTNIEHVWQVQVQRRGIAEERGIIGNYHLCLSDKSLALVRTGQARTLTGENRVPSVEFLLTTIRRCGDSQCYFYMEVGRHSVIGPGELWMGTEDPLIAQNMHTTIIGAMSAITKRDDFGPITRIRSSSANEASRPSQLLQRRQTHVGTKPFNVTTSTGIGRERCDSLPTRNRSISDTIHHPTQQNSSMPPPRSIPLANRPHSMYTNRHSHSPPMHTTPLSPSAGCSESDGSSLSIDETDGFSNPITPDEGGNWKYYNQRTTGSVIPEENPDDFFYGDNRKSPDMSKRNGSLSLPITQIVRKGSPAPPTNYMDMCSPCGSSPGDHPPYLMMSPGVELGRSLYTNSSGAHSRASSLAEDTENGCYVDTDQVDQESYVDMEQSRRPVTSGMSSAASSCSITSGTPSTDLRFAEYQLEKVVSRFTPDDEDTSLMERPLRAYSVGSRLEHNKRRLRVELLTSEHINARTRAFSVGSKAKVARSDLYRGTIQTAPLSSLTQHDAANVTNNNVNKSNKSSSAPILITKGSASTGPMDDLMEIDFTSNSTPPPLTQPLLSNQQNSPIQSSTPMKMSLPVQVPAAKKFDGLNELLSSTKPSGYVEMKPAINSYEPMFPGARQDYSYMDMKPVGSSGGNKNSFKTLLSMSTSPIKSPKGMGSLNRNNNYMDMSMTNQHQPVGQSPRGSMDDYLNMSPMTHSISHSRDIETDLPKTLSAPEGYMEMFFSKPNAMGGQHNHNNNNNNNNISDKPVSDEYIYMNAGRPTYNSTVNKNEPRLSSLPIDIQLNRKKNNVPLTTGTAMRCDSKDSGIVTPSGSHPAMFPFSPSSQFSSQTSIDENNLPRKCLVDGTTGTLRLSEEEEEQPQQSIVTSFTKNLKSLKTDVPMDTSSSCILRPQVEVLSNEYSDMSIGGSSLSKTTTRSLTRASSVLDSSDGEYAIMNATRKLSAPVQQSIPSVLSASSKKVPLNNSSEKPLTNPFGLFKPISSNADEMLMRNVVSPTNSETNRHTAFTRQLSERPVSSHTTDSTGYEMLHIRSDANISYQGGGSVSTRPNSVNSEKISKTSSATLTRPNSVNCDRLPTSTSSSTSTLCGSSSSSSTLCGSKSQSPSQTMRPSSFTDSDSVTTVCATVNSRPPSVSSERGLHYANLDLPPSTGDAKISAKLKVDIGVATNTMDLQQQLSKSSSGDSSTSPSPNANNIAHGEQSTFTYAQIDFVKCSERAAEMNTLNNSSCSPTKPN